MNTLRNTSQPGKQQKQHKRQKPVCMCPVSFVECYKGKRRRQPRIKMKVPLSFLVPVCPVLPQVGGPLSGSLVQGLFQVVLQACAPILDTKEGDDNNHHHHFIFIYLFF